MHNVAALRDVFGDLRVIGATAACVNPAIGRMDTLRVLFRSEGTDRIPPVSGVLDLGFSVTGAAEDRLQVLGSQGMALVEGTTLTVVGGAGALAVSEHPDDGGYLAEHLDFRRAITTGQAPKSTFEKAYGDLASILGAIDRADWIG